MEEEPPPPPPEPMPVDVSMMLQLSSAAQTRLKGVPGLMEAGDSDTIEIPAREMVTVATETGTTGVTFTCQSMYPCTVMVTNSLGTITAEYTTMRMPDGAAAMVSESIPAAPRMAMDVAGANRVNAAALHNLIEGAGVVTTNVKFSEPATATGSNAVTQQTTNDTTARGTAAANPGIVQQAMVKKLMRSGDGAAFELMGDLVEGIGTANDAAADDDEPMIESTPVVSDTMPDDTDPVGLELKYDGGDDDLSTDLAGWRDHQLMRDWQHRLPDDPEDAPLYAGFETNALIFENIGTDKMRAFDKMFTLTNGMLGSISGDPMMNLANEASLAKFEYDGAAMTYQNKKEQNEHFRGTFAGVSGTYQCGAICWLTKHRKTGAVGVWEDGSNAPGTTAATLSFTPDDPEAMASIPDWTYMAFGVWMTSPATKGGQHSFGIVDQAGGLASMIGTNAGSYNITAVDGEAIYKGPAVGYYAMMGENAAVGAFTASAKLTATFDGASDDTLMGQVSNFHDANGNAMDEWVVNLDTVAAITATGGATGTTSGHANSDPWTGNWRAQLSGVPKDDMVTGLTLSGGTVQATITAAEASDFPTGVVGAFDAHNTTTAVTGAFGANFQPEE